MTMECGQRLLGILELGGAILITTGLAVRAAVQRLCYKPYEKTPSLIGSRVLIIGADKSLQNELTKQFVLRGCHVAQAGLPNIKNDTAKNFYICNPIKPKQLEDLAKQIDEEFGKLDIVIHMTDVTQFPCLEPIDEIVDVIENSLMEHFHVVSQFVPDLARRSGCFVTIEPQRSIHGSFLATKSAITSLSDTLTQQLYEGNKVHIIRALRRIRRQSDEENIEDSAIAILNAIETGRNSVTLPTVKQHVKNNFRRLYIEMCHLWNGTIRQRKINN